MTHLAPEYVTARRVLLDALSALEGHLDNLILVGAQAVYHHAGEADLNVPLLTTDGDLAIDTHDLADAPEIGRALREAGFTPGPNPGHWVTIGDVAVDLMVVPHQAGTTRASARAAPGPAALLTAKAIKISERLGQVDTQPEPARGERRSGRLPDPASHRHPRPGTRLHDPPRGRARCRDYS